MILTLFSLLFVVNLLRARFKSKQIGARVRKGAPPVKTQSIQKNKRKLIQWTEIIFIGEILFHIEITKPFLLSQDQTSKNKES